MFKQRSEVPPDGLHDTGAELVGFCLSMDFTDGQRDTLRTDGNLCARALFEPDAPATGTMGFEEIIANAAIYGNGVFFHHMHQQALKGTIHAIELFEQASANGVPVIGEIYPNNYGASIVGTDHLKPHNYKPNMGHGYNGIIETATLRPLTKKRYDYLMETNPGTSIMFYGSTEGTMHKALAHPSSVIGSDSFPLTVSKTGEAGARLGYAVHSRPRPPAGCGDVGHRVAARAREETDAAHAGGKQDVVHDRRLACRQRRAADGLQGANPSRRRR